MATENQKIVAAVAIGGILGYFLFHKKSVQAQGDVTLNFSTLIAQEEVTDVQGNLRYGPTSVDGSVTLPVGEYNINMSLPPVGG